MAGDCPKSLRSKEGSRFLGNTDLSVPRGSELILKCHMFVITQAITQKYWALLKRSLGSGSVQTVVPDAQGDLGPEEA